MLQFHQYKTYKMYDDAATANSPMKWTNFKRTLSDTDKKNDCVDEIHNKETFIGSLWPFGIKLVLACGAPFSWQTVLAVADGLKSSCCCALPVGVDSCCHCLCHCLCGQTVKPALSLLAEYYNTANASSDPWNLPSIEMNHTDGGFVIQQNCPSTRPRANISRYIWHSIRINQFSALQVHLSRCYVVCVLSILCRLHYYRSNTYFCLSFTQLPHNVTAKIISVYLWRGDFAEHAWCFSALHCLTFIEFTQIHTQSALQTVLYCRPGKGKLDVRCF